MRDSLLNDTRLLLLEDAPVRSMKPGRGQIYGLVADSRGIYYDATGKSDLIVALETGAACGWMAPLSAQVSQLIDRFRETKASKYNWYPGDFERVTFRGEVGVMVIDQTRGDSSLAHGGMRQKDFDRMIRDALDEHQTGPIYLRAHPDHRYRNKHSCFPSWVFREPRIELLPPDLSPARCFEFCTEIYAGTSLMGMEALIHGRKVKSYGWNFYAGWGLTEDRCETKVKPRPRPLNLGDLFQAAYLQYSHYFDPDSGESCGLGRILDHIELQRAVASENVGLRVTVGWTPWARRLAEDFFRTPGSKLDHADSLPSALNFVKRSSETKLLLWGAAAGPVDPLQQVVRVEDGFLRSSGLGAKFHRPLSWVLDDVGIYFDPRTPSRLESILEDGNFTQREMADTEQLLDFLRRHRLTKYNVAGEQVIWDSSLARGRKVILVPGQVEADASILCGSPEVRTNGELLRRVRAAEPEAFLIFKAHPDLVAGARHGHVMPPETDSLADLAVTDGNVLDWLELCDEVHTMTSTLGFESILRGVPVVTYGLPFYAGWGLTRDHLSCARRRRRLTVNELACGAMIRYPRYLNPNNGEFTTAIQIASLLSQGILVGVRRAWYLQILSILKHGWVKVVRQGGL